MVIHAGATSLEEAVKPDQLPKVLAIFMDALQDAFVLPIVLSGIAFFVSLMLTKNMRVKGGIKLQGA